MEAKTKIYTNTEIINQDQDLETFLISQSEQISRSEVRLSIEELFNQKKSFSKFDIDHNYPYNGLVSKYLDNNFYTSLVIKSWLSKTYTENYLTHLILGKLDPELLFEVFELDYNRLQLGEKKFFSSFLALLQTPKFKKFITPSIKSNLKDRPVLAEDLINMFKIPAENLAEVLYQNKPNWMIQAESQLPTHAQIVTEHNELWAEIQKGNKIYQLFDENIGVLSDYDAAIKSFFEMRHTTQEKLKTKSLSNLAQSADLALLAEELGIVNLNSEIPNIDEVDFSKISDPEMIQEHFLNNFGFRKPFRWQVKIWLISQIKHEFPKAIGEATIRDLAYIREIIWQKSFNKQVIDLGAKKSAWDPAEFLDRMTKQFISSSVNNQDLNQKIINHGWSWLRSNCRQIIPINDESEKNQPSNYEQILTKISELKLEVNKITFLD